MADTTHYKAYSRDEHNRTVLVEGDVTVFDLPTVQVSAPNGPVYAGDKIIFQVTGTTDAEAGPGVLSLWIDGAQVALDAEGKYEWTAP